MLSSDAVPPPFSPQNHRMFWWVQDSRKHFHQDCKAATTCDVTKWAAANSVLRWTTDTIRPTSSDSQILRFSSFVLLLSLGLHLGRTRLPPQVPKVPRTKGTSFRGLLIELGGTIPPSSLILTRIRLNWHYASRGSKVPFQVPNKFGTLSKSLQEWNERFIAEWS